MADLGLIEQIKRSFNLPEADASQYSPLVLAYIGDCVYELVNRTVAVSRANKQVEKLHRECAGRANAGSQSRLIEGLEEKLTDEELRIYKRGRNAGVNTKAKNQTTADYHRATGLEALIGYLYMTGRYERLTELLTEGFENIDAEEK